MELSRSGADLLGANEAAVLRVLAHRSDALSGREIARLSGASSSSVRRVLERLVDTGMVSVEAQRHALLYRANRRHVLWGPVLDILGTRSTIEAELAALVRDRMGDAATAAIFGSVARGEATAESDVDVVLVVPEDVDDTACAALVDDLGDLVRSRAGNEAQVVVVGREQLRGMVRDGDPLVAAWANEAITLTGTSLSALIAA